MNPQLSQFTAIIGIDWADTKHDICVQEREADTREFSKILHKVDKIHEWAQTVSKLFTESRWSNNDATLVRVIQIIGIQ